MQNEMKYSRVNTDLLFVMSVIMGPWVHSVTGGMRTWKKNKIVCLLGKVRLQTTEIIASVKNYYSRKNRLIYYSFVFLNEIHSSDGYPSKVKEMLKMNTSEMALRVHLIQPSFGLSIFTSFQMVWTPELKRSSC